MSEQTVVRSRRIDSGDPLILRDPPEAKGPDAYGVDTATCSNPRCPCEEMELHVYRAARLPNGNLELGSRVARGEVSADGTGAKIDGAASELAATTTSWLCEQLRQESSAEWLRARWRRARGQCADPHFPPGTVSDDDIARLVSFCDAFPYDFDLVVGLDGSGYWAEDQYCLRPGCSCDDVVVHFVEAEKRSASVGDVRASIRHLDEPHIDGGQLLSRLWKALIDRHGEGPLRERFERMRDFARRRSSSGTRSAPARVGRNELCLCGSGKKHKRCCGSPVA
jgi:SEC-C motif